MDRSLLFKNFTLAFTAIFVALDIIGALPIYLAMTRELRLKDRRRIINTSMLVAFLVAVVFLFLGQAIFQYIGISIFDFKIAGGIVLLLVSLADLVNGPDAVHKSSGSTGIVPLAVPLITGPAILATLILQAGVFGYLATVLALTANYILGWIFLRNSETVARVLGKEGTVIISKIAALLLAAIAISMIRGGVFGAIIDFRGS